MFKLAAIISLMLISILSSVSSSCDSCGSECTSSCGTRHFRTCCFNYLRKKRGPDAIKFYTSSQDSMESQPRLPLFVVDDIPMPEQWFSSLLSNENYPYRVRDTTENHMNVD